MALENSQNSLNFSRIPMVLQAFLNVIVMSRSTSSTFISSFLARLIAASISDPGSAPNSLPSLLWMEAKKTWAKKKKALPPLIISVTGVSSHFCLFTRTSYLLSSSSTATTSGLCSAIAASTSSTLFLDTWAVPTMTRLSFTTVFI